MGQQVYYHNITQGWFNKNDYAEAAEESEKGDIIKMSFRGNALVIDLIEVDLRLEDKGEHDWARNQFLEHFEEYNGESFLFLT